MTTKETAGRKGIYTFHVGGRDDWATEPPDVLEVRIGRVDLEEIAEGIRVADAVEPPSVFTIPLRGTLEIRFLGREE